VSCGGNILEDPKKNCLPEYVGTELSLKGGEKSLRADVFDVSNGKFLYSKEE